VSAIAFSLFSLIYFLLYFQLKELLPADYEIIRQWVDRLPANKYSPVYPFGGYVININCATQAHRDYGDLQLCFIIVISDCEGGELVLVEPGLVLHLRNGDAVIFSSSKTTHLNAHYKGFRSSFVFHSDRHSETWVKHRNYWAFNIEFKTSEPHLLNSML